LLRWYEIADRALQGVDRHQIRDQYPDRRNQQSCRRARTAPFDIKSNNDASPKVKPYPSRDKGKTIGSYSL